MKIFLFILGLLVSTAVYAGDIGPGAAQQSDLIKFYDSIIVNTLNCAKNSAGLDIASTTTNVETNATVSYTVDGVFYSAAPSASIAVPAMSAQPVSTYAKYLVAINAAGTFLITRGNISAFEALAELPALTTGYAPIGYFQVLTNSSTTFTPGTTGLDNAGITDTYVNIGAMNSGKYKMSRLGR